jgi:hypothetical protein
MAVHSVAWMARLKVVLLAELTVDRLVEWTVTLTAGSWDVCSVD